jgi:C4-dicarboxylate transporter DctQ subunit
MSWDLSWAQELCIFMFVWMAKFGAAYGVRTGVHVGVDVAINQLRTPSRYYVILFGLFCGAFFTFVIGSFGARFVWHMIETGQTSSDLEVPMWIVYLAVPLGSYLMCFRFFQVAWTFARTGDLPHVDEAHVEGLDKVAPVMPAVEHEVVAAPAKGAAR